MGHKQKWRTSLGQSHGDLCLIHSLEYFVDRAPTFLPGRSELNAGLLKGFLQLCTASFFLLQGQLQLIVLQRNLCG